MDPVAIELLVAVLDGRFERLLIAELTDLTQQHAHKCINVSCGFIWSHTGQSAGDQLAHMCPQCGHGPVWRRW